MIVYGSLNSSFFSFVHSSGTGTESVMDDGQEVGETKGRRPPYCALVCMKNVLYDLHTLNPLFSTLSSSPK